MCVWGGHERGGGQRVGGVREREGERGGVRERRGEREGEKEDIRKRVVVGEGV